jgi:hypothetical protein
MPLMCWLYKQPSAFRSISAHFWAAICKCKIFVSSTLALCYYPTADELSPNAKKHVSPCAYSFFIAIHTDLTEAINSSELFWFMTACQNSRGIVISTQTLWAGIGPTNEGWALKGYQV